MIQISDAIGIGNSHASINGNASRPNATTRASDTFPSPGTREFRRRVRKLLEVERPRLRRLWAYYANPMRPRAVAADDAGSARPYQLGQEWGLPSRITGARVAGVFGPVTDDADGVAQQQQQIPGVSRKEVVIENDIGWRIDTLVDYLFGKPVVINSAAPDPARRAVISELLRMILAQHGGIVFLQQLALLGAVYGYIDVLVKFDATSCDADLDTHAGACSTQDVGQPPACDGDPRAAASAASSATVLPPDGAGPSATAAGSPSPASNDQGPSAATNGDAEASTTRASDASSADTSSSGGDGSSSASRTTPGASDNSRGATAGAKAANLSSPTSSIAIDRDWLSRLARRVRLEIVEPARALPLLSLSDYRRVDAYAQVYEAPQADEPERAPFRVSSRRALGLLGRLRSRAANLLGASDDGADVGCPSSNDRTLVVEVITPTTWRRYEDDVLVDAGHNSLGRVPLVHVQNTAVPFAYAGASDVEPMIPLQDELNTRMSDRAYRITMQSFKMYLGKGVEGFTEMPVAPGRMWMTDNENADILTFGGDSKTFSEDNHIADVRQGLDKISGVTPIAAGALKGRIGRLTSAAALRVTMLALLAKTERKRTAWQQAIAQMAELALAWLDRAGLFPNTPDERAIEMHWPSPIPVNELERLEEAQAKLNLGIAPDVVLRELGY